VVCSIISGTRSTVVWSWWYWRCTKVIGRVTPPHFHHSILHHHQLSCGRLTSFQVIFHRWQQQWLRKASQTRSCCVSWMSVHWLHIDMSLTLLSNMSVLCVSRCFECGSVCSVCVIALETGVACRCFVWVYWMWLCVFCVCSCSADRSSMSVLCVSLLNVAVCSVYVVALQTGVACRCFVWVYWMWLCVFCVCSCSADRSGMLVLCVSLLNVALCVLCM